MMIAYLLSTLLITLAVLHILWGIGYWFPIRDEASLARAVTGFPDAETMPGAVPCSLVAVALMFAVFCLWWPPGPFRFLALFLFGAVFVARGGATFTRAWRKLTPVEPFATLDRKYYGPLCLVMGLMFWLSI